MAKRNNKTGEVNIPNNLDNTSSHDKTTLGDVLHAIEKMNKNFQKTTTADTDKLLKTIVGLNDTIGNLSQTLNKSTQTKRNRRNNEEITADKLKIEREQNENKHQLEMQKLQEQALRKRLKYMEENQKRYLEKHYGNSLGSLPSRMYHNIKGQQSNAFSASILSLMTGGFINPVIAKEFGLDKILTATTKLAGRTAGKLWDVTGGAAFRNMIQPFVDPKSTFRTGTASGANKVRDTFSKNWFGLFNKNEEAGKTEGVVAKDKDKVSKIEKHVQDISNTLKNPKETTKDKKEKTEKKGILTKLFEAVGGLGLILKGAAVAAIPYAIKAIFPNMTKWLDKKLKEFLSGTIGLSDESSAGVSQLIKDALPGAMFGMTVGGWKGALIGGSLSIGANWIVDKWNEFKNDANKEGEEPAKIGPFTKSQFEAVILGMTLGSLKGSKSMLIGGIVGYTVDTLASWGAEAINTIKAIKNGDISGLDAAAEIGKMVGVSGSLVLAAIYGFKLGGPTGMLAAIAAVTAADLIADVVAQAVGPDEDLSKISEEERNERGKRLAIKNALKQAKETGKSSPLLEMYKQSDPELVKEMSGIIEKEENKGFFAKAWDKVTFNNEDVGDYKGAVAKKGKTGEKGAGGYGTFGPKSTNSFIHGRSATGLKEMGLKGTVVSTNSIPYIAANNEEALKFLDKTISDWGYDIIYTSAMGGHKEGTGHWKGNKIDLQLKKNGIPTHLTSEQLNALGKAGYWGKGTGALGWEPVSGQVGGGHYDLFIGNGGNSTLGSLMASASNATLNTDDMLTTQESQSFTMNEMNETAQTSAENTINSNGSILDLLGNMNNNIVNSTSLADTATAQAINVALQSAPNIAVAAGGTNGGAGNQTGTVYAFGDVARTPILYTL